MAGWFVRSHKTGRVIWIFRNTKRLEKNFIQPSPPVEGNYNQPSSRASSKQEPSPLWLAGNTHKDKLKFALFFIACQGF